MRDARRFTRYYIGSAEEHPLQLYTSVLVFTSPDTTVTKAFEEQKPKWLKTKLPGAGPKVQSLKAPDTVTKVHVAPNSVLLASSGGSTIAVWDPETSRCLHAMEHRLVTDIVFSPDSKLLASRVAVNIAWDTITGHRLPVPSINRAIKVWDVEAGCCVRELRGGWESVSSIAISRDSKLLASVSDDATIRIWSLESGRRLHKLPGFKRGLNSVNTTWVAFSRGSTSLVSGSYNDHVVIWTRFSDQWKCTFKSSWRDTEALSFSPDGTCFAVVSKKESDTVVVCSMITGESLRSYRGNGDRVDVLTFSDHDSTLGFTSNSAYDGRYIIHVHSSTARGLNVKLRASHRQQQITFSPGSRFLASTSGWNSVDIWDLSARRVIWSVDHGKDTPISSFTLSSDWLLLFSVSGSSTINIWEAGTPASLTGSVTFPPGQSRTLPKSIFSSAKRILRGLSLSAEDTSQNANSHTKSVDSLRVSPAGDIVISTSSDQSVKFFHVDTGRCLNTLHGQYDKWFNYSTSFSHDSKLLAWPSEDCTIKMIDTSTAKTSGNPIKVFDNIRPLTISYNLQLLAVSRQYKNLEIWDLLKPAPRVGKWCEGTIEGAIFSWGDKLVAILFRDTVCILDWRSGKSVLVRSARGLVAFSHDEMSIASVDDSGSSIHILSTATGNCSTTLTRRGNGVRALGFSRDSRQLAVSDDRTIQVWRVDDSECLWTFQMGRPVMILAFDERGAQLKTEIGDISLGVLAGKNPVNGESAEGVHRRGYGLSSDGRWVMRASERFLFLPIEFCATCFVATSSRVAIGCKSGVVLIFDFAVST